MEKKTMCKRRFREIGEILEAGKIGDIRKIGELRKAGEFGEIQAIRKILEILAAAWLLGIGTINLTSLRPVTGFTTSIFLNVCDSSPASQAIALRYASLIGCLIVLATEAAFFILMRCKGQWKFPVLASGAALLCMTETDHIISGTKFYLEYWVFMDMHMHLHDIEKMMEIVDDGISAVTYLAFFVLLLCMIYARLEERSLAENESESKITSRSKSRGENQSKSENESKGRGENQNQNEDFCETKTLSGEPTISGTQAYQGNGMSSESGGLPSMTGRKKKSVMELVNKLAGGCLAGSLLFILCRSILELWFVILCVLALCVSYLLLTRMENFWKREASGK